MNTLLFYSLGFLHTGGFFSLAFHLYVNIFFKLPFVMRKANPRWQKSFFLHFFLFSFSERENKGINQWRRAKPVDLFLNIDETTQRLCSLNQGQLYYSSHSIQGQRGADPLLPNFQNKKSQTKVYLQASILHVCVSSRHVCKGLWFKSLQLPTKQLQPACPFFFPA